MMVISVLSAVKLVWNLSKLVRNRVVKDSNARSLGASCRSATGMCCIGGELIEYVASANR